MATLPGAFLPSLTGNDDCGRAVFRKCALVYSGKTRSLCTPKTDCITVRAGRALLARLTICTTTGMEASLPTASVLVSILSRSIVSPFLNLTALARSITCGKSTFHGWGGTYGHLDM